jgi:protein-disulfide isomerase
MKRIGLLLLSAATVLGCQRDDSPLRKEIADLKAGQKDILKALENMPAARPGANRPQRPQRPRPKPNAVYSVNIKGSPFIGAKDAKVTIVEAFEFA